MGSYFKVLIILIIILLGAFVLLVQCEQGTIYGDPVDRAEKIYKEQSDTLYQIINFLNDTGISEIYTDKKDEEYYTEVSYCYIDNEGSSGLTSDRKQELYDVIHKFMIQNMIDAIHKYESDGITYISFTVRHGWNAVAVLLYCPQVPDINSVEEAYCCNGRYIDDSWIVLDYQDEL